REARIGRADGRADGLQRLGPLELDREVPGAVARGDARHHVGRQDAQRERVRGVQHRCLVGGQTEVCEQREGGRHAGIVHGCRLRWHMLFGCTTHWGAPWGSLDATAQHLVAISAIYNRAVEYTTAIWNERLVDDAD